MFVNLIIFMRWIAFWKSIVPYPMQDTMSCDWVS